MRGKASLVLQNSLSKIETGPINLRSQYLAGAGRREKPHVSDKVYPRQQRQQSSTHQIRTALLVCTLLDVATRETKHPKPLSTSRVPPLCAYVSTKCGAFCQAVAVRGIICMSLNRTRLRPSANRFKLSAGRSINQICLD